MVVISRQGILRMKIVGVESLGYLRQMNWAKFYGQKPIKRIMQQTHGQRM